MEGKRGVIIVIEGGDASGKATQTKLLVDRLNSEGISAKHMSFPRYNTPTGRIIGQCYLGKNGLGEGDVGWFGDPTKIDPLIASLYYAADRRAAVPEINEILDSGTHLILDRYYQANMAHQGGKIDSQQERINYFEKVGKIELDALEIPREDRTIFLHMPLAVALELMKGRNEDKDGHERSREHLVRAEEVYKRLTTLNYTWEQINCAPDGTINSLKTPEKISEAVYTIAKRTIDWKMHGGEYHFKEHPWQA